MPLLIQHALHIVGTSHRDYSTDAKKLAEAQIFACERYGCDGLHITSDNQIISEAFGCALRFPPDEPPQYLSRVLSGGLESSKLKVPDPLAAGRMPVVLEAAKIARRTLGDEYFIKVNSDSGPFSVAAALRGEEAFFVDLYEDEYGAVELLEICTEAAVAYALAIAKSGAHAVTFGDSTAGLIGRSLYEKYALPYQKQLVSAVKETGLPVFMHMCGDVTQIIDLMAETGADALEIDSQIDLGEAYEKTGGKVCLVGNVDTILMLSGSAGDIFRASRGCVDASGGRRLILSAGCEVPRHTPGENIEAMIGAAGGNDSIVQ